MIKYTPAPWKMHGGTNIVGGGPGYDLLAQTMNKDIKKSFDESIANAHLIAAAPDLLKELERMYFYVEALRQDGKIDKKCEDATKGALTKALKVITKAKGE